MGALLRYVGIQGLVGLMKDQRIKFVALLYLLLSFIILFRVGVYSEGEAVKYINDATRILSHQGLDRGVFAINYIVYSLLLAIVLKFGISFFVIAAMQIILSLIAGLAIYKILFKITGNFITSILSCLLFLSCLTIQEWNYFLYTESFHVSFTVIALYFFYDIAVNKRFDRAGIFILVVFLIVFSRPVGIIYLLSLAPVTIILLYHKNKRIFYLSLFLSFLGLFSILCSHWIFYLNPDSLRRMEVICQVPTAGNHLPYAEYNTAGLLAFFKVITNDIGILNFLILGCKKLTSFFIMIRPFYSSIHNLLLLVTIFIFYPLAFFGAVLYKNSKSFYIKLFICFYLAYTSFGIFFTCDEWSNRFIVPVLPMIIILAGLGFEYIIQKISGNKEKDIINVN